MRMKEVTQEMIPGFTKIIEERIRHAQKNGDFDNLDGAGKPLKMEDDSLVPEDLRLAYKILKNADMTPPEIELKKEILRTEDLLATMSDEAEKYRTLKKLNMMIMRFNTMRDGSAEFDVPQLYADRLVEHLEKTQCENKK